jgi:hypothetical protein
MYHNFVIYSSVVGYLGCFQSLVIVNSAMVNMGVQEYLLLPYAILGICPGAVSRDHIAVLALIF